MKIGKKVYIKELDQVGYVETLTETGKVHTVSVVTAEGPKVIDIIEKGFNIVSLIATILGLLKSFFKGQG